MDAELLLRAQAEAVTASAAALSAVYLAREQDDPGRWLETGATELWRFATTRRLLTPPAAAWLILIAQPVKTGPYSLGLGIGGCLTDEQRRIVSSRIQPLIRMVSTSPVALNGGSVSPTAGVSLDGVLQASFDDGGGGRAVVLGGLLKTDGGLDTAVDDDSLIASMFAAIARAAGDCVVRPIVRRTSMMDRLSIARRRVLVHLVKGLTTHDISQRIERSPHTVHDHILAIFRTFDVTNRRDLIELWNGRAVYGQPPRENPPADAAMDIQVLTPASHRRRRASNQPAL